MSNSTYPPRLRLVLGVLVSALVVGCASTQRGADRPRASDTTPVASPSSPPHWPCLDGERARFTDAESTPVALLGAGRRAVVFANQSNEDLGAWLPFASQLAHAGFQVALFDYAAEPTVSLSSVARYVRAHGATSVVLLGASEGAKTVIMVGARLQPPVAAVVSLSAEAELAGTPVAPSAARLTVPTLYVTAADDRYAATEATRGFHASSPARTKRLVVVPGSQHGVGLLTDHSVSLAVTSFVERYAH